MNNTNVSVQIVGSADSDTQPYLSLGFTIERLKSTIQLWSNRRSTRQHLRELEIHLLDDIGVSPTEKNSEIAKFFWQQ